MMVPYLLCGSAISPLGQAHRRWATHEPMAHARRPLELRVPMGTHRKQTIHNRCRFHASDPPAVLTHENLRRCVHRGKGIVLPQPDRQPSPPLISSASKAKNVGCIF
jgi:hypothetical protein